MDNIDGHTERRVVVQIQHVVHGGAASALVLPRVFLKQPPTWVFVVEGERAVLREDAAALYGGQIVVTVIVDGLYNV